MARNSDSQMVRTPPDAASIAGTRCGVATGCASGTRLPGRWRPKNLAICRITITPRLPVRGSPTGNVKAINFPRIESSEQCKNRIGRWRERPLTGKFRGDPERQELADSRSPNSERDISECGRKRTRATLRLAIEDVVTFASLGNYTPRNSQDESRVCSFRDCAAEVPPVALACACVTAWPDVDRCAFTPRNLLQLARQQVIERIAIQPP